MQVIFEAQAADMREVATAGAFVITSLARDWRTAISGYAALPKTSANAFG